MTLPSPTLLLNRILRRAGSQLPDTAHAASLLVNARSTIPLQPWLRKRSFATAPLNDETDETASSSDHRLLDAYETLHLERSFALDPQVVKASYHRLMSDLHPDKHGQKALEEQLQLQERASQVTQSYQILKEPNSRATHLLQLLGKLEPTTDADESLTGQSVNEAATAQLLMEVMEIRESVDKANSDTELRPLWEEHQQRVQDVCRQLGDAFRAHELDAALQLTIQLKYWNKIGETIREKMDEMK